MHRRPDPDLCRHPKALEAVALELLGQHLDHCVRDAVLSGGELADQRLDEARNAIARLVRS